jgi:hypothetical protein
MAVVVLRPDKLVALDGELRAAGIDPDHARERGDLVTVDTDDALARVIVDGRVDHERFYAFTASVLDVAAERGCRIRICGEMAPMRWAAGDVVGAMELEQLWNTLPETPRFELLCLYAVHAFDLDDPADATSAFTAMCDLHSAVVPDESYTSLTDPADRDRMVAELQQQRRVAERAAEQLRARQHELETALHACTDQAHRRETQLNEAIETRDVIGQAKGLLMARMHVDADTAFHMLRNASSRGNLKVRDVARAVVERGIPPR